MSTKDNDDKSSTSNTDAAGTFTAAEEKARGLGHRSKDEWTAEGKDPDTWVSAEEFLRRAPLYEGLHKANRTVKSLEKKLNMLAQHQEELVNAKVARQLEQLKAEKKVAAKNHDVEKVEELNEAIEEVKKSAEKAKAKVEDKAEDAREMFEEWKSENKWYEEDEDMFAYANGIGSKLEKEHPEWGPERTLQEVSKRTKKAFEWKTKNPNRATASKVATSTSGNGDSGPAKGKMPTYNDLPPEAQAAYREFVKTDKNPHGFMTKEQYLKDYAVKAGLIPENE